MEYSRHNHAGLISGVSLQVSSKTLPADSDFMPLMILHQITLTKAEEEFPTEWTVISVILDQEYIFIFQPNFKKENTQKRI